MRRFDKNKNIQNINLLAEQRYLQSKELINENTNEFGLNETTGPFMFTKININYDNPEVVTDDKVNLCVSQVREKVNEILKDMFDPKWSFVEVSFNGKKYFER
jgi:hypothetical protein